MQRPMPKLGLRIYYTGHCQFPGSGGTISKIRRGEFGSHLAIRWDGRAGDSEETYVPLAMLEHCDQGNIHCANRLFPESEWKQVRQQLYDALLERCRRDNIL